MRRSRKPFRAASSDEGSNPSPSAGFAPVLPAPRNGPSCVSTSSDGLDAVALGVADGLPAASNASTANHLGTWSAWPVSSGAIATSSPIARPASSRASKRRSGLPKHLRERPAILNQMVQYSTPVDRAFAALADPTRRAVLERLGSGRATISELAEPFGMSLTGMKKHIRLLEEAQLVTTEKVGRVRRCMLAPYAFEGISTWLTRLDRFARVVERTKGDR
jgi:DNA-binding transcriptional ArsR family regulator